MLLLCWRFLEGISPIELINLPDDANVNKWFVAPRVGVCALKTKYFKTRIILLWLAKTGWIWVEVGQEFRNLPF